MTGTDKVHYVNSSDAWRPLVRPTRGGPSAGALAGPRGVPDRGGGHHRDDPGGVGLPAELDQSRYERYAA